MQPLIWVLVFLAWVSHADTKYRDEECPRIRHPLHALTEDERMLFVRGYQALRKNGKLKVLSDTHAANIAEHKGASFFAFHAYIIWEAETAIRELGDEFACFSMPYWDYTLDAGKEADPLIFHLNVGADGDPEKNYCMSDPLWQKPNYWSTDGDTCLEGEERPICCLKRSVSTTQVLPTTAEIASVFLNNDNFLLFEAQIDHYHAWPHFYLAVYVSSQMATAYAMDDPLFLLLHTFTLYQRALWTTCYEYDFIDVDLLQQYPDAYTPECNPDQADCGVVGVDAVYRLNPLDENDWAVAYSQDITPRKMYDITDWNVKYDLGSFYTRSKLNEWCEAKAVHDDIPGPSADWMVDMTSTYADVVWELENDNPLQNFIEDRYNELRGKQERLGLSEENLYLAVASISCKYHRATSENSCFDVDDQTLINRDYETCASQGVLDIDQIDLDYLLSLEGVQDSVCLTQRREEMYSITQGFDDLLLLAICNGDFDYPCPEWEHKALDHKKLQRGEVDFIGDLTGDFAKEYDYDYNTGYDFMLILSLGVFAVILLAFVVKTWWCGNYAISRKQNALFAENDGDYGTF
eukprot:CAMPEP_0202690690 /NCGR_PEP_ID=MMETSP1385-20130828/5606_1 /ASSEMBLY_ACC=CAM_ASM_000861 /TAXON_ID=933848 /ORGANISM="Elphidium margaritaceum" /LENGTH=577 /DNA_ID=CAMNT_0049345975 /DNA_START=36 /DNA_END=1769 /DNA_ORIENTATION=-